MTAVAVKEYIGSTSSFYEIEEGMILKSLHPVLAEREGYKVIVEMKILERLGEHPSIVKYRGYHDGSDLKGLLFLEASHGSLQAYIDQNNNSLPMPLRKKWCRQATEAIQYIHSKGIIHSDLPPENYLVHASSSRSLDLQLCDFGGAMCQDLGLDGRGLPDPPFWDLKWESTVGTDIFSLGSIFYTVMTGLLPYKSRHLTKEEEEEEDRWQFEDRVVALLEKGVYPEVEGITGGTIMMRCWKKQYLTAEDVLQAQMDLAEELTE